MKEFPTMSRQILGKNLLNLQMGLEPFDWKPFNQIGLSTVEIRVHRPNEYRLFCVVRFPEAIYVLNVFEKKTQKTSKNDIQPARQRYVQLQKERKRES